jgi:hypothetical protein
MGYNSPSSEISQNVKHDGAYRLEAVPLGLVASG